MIKQTIFSLTLAIGVAYTVAGQTTTMPRSQTTGSTMSNSQTGTSGTSSMSGTSGTSSMSGTSGTSSMSGTSGTSSMSGTSGMSSMSGTSGTSSMSGTSGMANPSSGMAPSSQTGSPGMSTSSGSMSSTSGSMSSSSGSSMGTSTGKDLAASAGLSSDHSTLLKALVAAGLADRAKGTGPFTVFAPTNAAFSKLPAATLANLMMPSMKKQLAGILSYHVVQGSFKAADLTDGQSIKTVTGETLTVSKQGSTVMIKDAKGGSATVTMADIQATNGIVHSIDSVLMPSK